MSDTMIPETLPPEAPASEAPPPPPAPAPSPVPLGLKIDALQVALTELRAKKRGEARAACRQAFLARIGEKACKGLDASRQAQAKIAENRRQLQAKRAAAKTPTPKK